MEHGEFINYDVSIWSYDGYKFTLDETLSTHKCNETDKSILAQSFESIDPAIE